jgi:hypothetical protein
MIYLETTIFDYYSAFIDFLLYIILKVFFLVVILFLFENPYGGLALVCVITLVFSP